MSKEPSPQPCHWFVLISLLLLEISLPVFAQTSAPVAVAVTPATASVIGLGKQQFAATVSNTTNTAVAWAVNGVAGGNATLGTISATGLYTAPPVLSGPAVRVIAAISQADKSINGRAHVTWLPVAISLSPGAATLLDGGTQKFTASVLNAANTAVTWSVNGVVGGSAATGTISAQGLYSAPPVIVPAGKAVILKAVSQADTTKWAKAVVTLKGIIVTVAPTALSLPGGGKQQFTATLENSPSPVVTWQVNGITGGNARVGKVSATGLYQAPAVIASAATVRVMAFSPLDIHNRAIVNVNLLPVTITANPASATLIGGATQQFTASVQNAVNPAVTWQVNGVAGGSAATGTISSSGLYTAPVGVSAQTTVTVAAVLQADPTQSASALITINPVTITGHASFGSACHGRHAAIRSGSAEYQQQGDYLESKRSRGRECNPRHGYDYGVLFRSRFSGRHYGCDRGRGLAS